MRRPMITLDGKTPRYGWKWEDASARAHYDKWEHYAETLGITNVEGIVLRGVASQQLIREALETERGLNAIPLSRWDAMDGFVRSLAHSNGFRSWSLSDTVCVLKHVAQYYVANDAIPQEFSDQDALSDETHNTTQGYNFWCRECFDNVFGFRAQHKEHKRGVYSPAVKR